MFVSEPELRAVWEEVERIHGRARRSGRWVDVETDEGGTWRRYVGEPTGVTFSEATFGTGLYATIRCLYGGEVVMELEGGTATRIRDKASRDPHGGALVVP